MDRGEALFSKYDFRSALRNAPAGLAKAIEELPDKNLFDDDQEKLVSELVADHLIQVPTLDLDGTKPSQREVEIDVSRDPHQRLMRDLSGPYYVKATEVSFRVPYNGDADVFRCRPSTYTLNPPYADIGADAIVIRVVRQDQTADEYRKEFDRTIAQIQESLERLRSDCAGLENTLRESAASHLAKRREKRQKDRSLIDDLGFGKPKI